MLINVQVYVVSAVFIFYKVKIHWADFWSAKSVTY